eukprot:COSAG03_NODE_3410_length_2034_cov_5.937468_2_plen_289_part_00
MPPVDFGETLSTDGSASSHGSCSIEHELEDCFKWHTACCPHVLPLFVVAIATTALVLCCCLTWLVRRWQSFRRRSTSERQSLLSPRSAADSSGRPDHTTDYPSMGSSAHADRVSVPSRGRSGKRGKTVQTRTLPSGERAFVRLDGTNREKGRRERQRETERDREKQRESERKKRQPESGRRTRPRQQPDISAQNDTDDRRKTHRKTSKTTQKRGRKSAPERAAPGDADTAHAAATERDGERRRETERDGERVSDQDGLAGQCDSAYPVQHVFSSLPATRSELLDQNCF